MESNDGLKAFTFTVTRTGYLGTVTTVNYAVAGSEVDAADFGGQIPSGTVTFQIGSATQTIAIFVQGDTSPESDEAFQVVISGASGNANITSSSATTTILNDDAL